MGDLRRGRGLEVKEERVKEEPEENKAPDKPLLLHPQSPIWALRFILHGVHQLLGGGGGGCGWIGGGCMRTSRCRLGGAEGVWQWQLEKGNVGCPPGAGVKMFRLA